MVHSRSRGVFAAAFALMALVVAGQLAAAAGASQRPKPMALVSYYESYRFPEVLRALNRTGVGRHGRVFFGNYWGSPRGAKGPPPRTPVAHAAERYEFAPILALRPGIFWERRRVTRKEKGVLSKRGDGRLTGAIPSMGSLVHGSVSSRVRWGRELGRRFRDHVRAKLRSGKDVAAWQFDEVLAAGTPYGAAKRDLSSGILLGLLHGRPALGDREMRGFVWAAASGLPLGRGLSGGGYRFWSLVNAAALRLVVEEYVPFQGSPRAAAARSASRRWRFGAAGGARGALAHRYMVGLTPGFKADQSLGGNVGRLSLGRANGWRRAYVRARGRDYVAGFAVYNLMGVNSRPSVIGAVVGAVALGVRMRL